jgi:hypothetical protein
MQLSSLIFAALAGLALGSPMGDNIFEKRVCWLGGFTF